MIDLFESQEVTIPELLRRIEALEQMVFANAPREPHRRLVAPPALQLAWARWCSYRKTQKGWTADAQSVNLNKLMELAGLDGGEAANAIVAQSIERGWTGLFPLKGDKPASSIPQTKTVKQALAPSESKYDQQVAYIRHQCELGAMTKPEAQAAIAALEG